MPTNGLLLIGLCVALLVVIAVLGVALFVVEADERRDREDHARHW